MVQRGSNRLRAFNWQRESPRRLPVEKTVERFRGIYTKLVIFPLANSHHILIHGTNPYISMAAWDFMQSARQDGADEGFLRVSRTFPHFRINIV
jgi:hypothetical protein